MSVASSTTKQQTIVCVYLALWSWVYAFYVDMSHDYDRIRLRIANEIDRPYIGSTITHTHNDQTHPCHCVVCIDIGHTFYQLESNMSCREPSTFVKSRRDPSKLKMDSAHWHCTTNRYTDTHRSSQSQQNEMVCQAHNANATTTNQPTPRS